MYNNIQEGKSVSLMEQLIQTALKNEHSKFEFLLNFKSYQLANSTLKPALRKTIRAFKKAKSKSYEDYINKKKKNIDDLSAVNAVRLFNTCIKYYTEELNITKDITNEFFWYLMSGHIIYSLCGYNRREKDLFDYRIQS